ncbi:hypothetical protein JB92DRAFT_2769227, partial [Gautieria morchelliformis]
FHSNISGLKHLAAHDFEDILLCSIAVFDGLLPSPHDEIVLSLLFIAYWFHSLVKLKMHTRVTLMALITTMFGRQMCRFKSQTCDIITTFELDCEVSAHARRLAHQNLASPTPARGKKPKTLNLLNYKFHALGDYISTIHWFRTTDSYSTQTVHPMDTFFYVI